MKERKEEEESERKKAEESRGASQEGQVTEAQG